jgi:hypothetical protein
MYTYSGTADLDVHKVRICISFNLCKDGYPDIEKHEIHPDVQLNGTELACKAGTRYSFKLVLNKNTIKALVLKTSDDTIYEFYLSKFHCRSRFSDGKMVLLDCKEDLNDPYINEFIINNIPKYERQITSYWNRDLLIYWKCYKNVNINVDQFSVTLKNPPLPMPSYSPVYPKTIIKKIKTPKKRGPIKRFINYIIGSDDYINTVHQASRSTYCQPVPTYYSHEVPKNITSNLPTSSTINSTPVKSEEDERMQRKLDSMPGMRKISDIDEKAEPEWYINFPPLL